MLRRAWSAVTSYLAGRAVALLRVLRLWDPDDNGVSITNAMAWVAIVRLAVFKDANAVELSALVIAMLSYRHKAMLAQKRKSQAAQNSPPVFDPGGVVAALQTTVAKVEAKVKDLDAFVGTVRLGSGGPLGRR